MTPSPERVVRLPPRRRPRIAIFAEPRDAHAAWLKRGFSRLGARAVDTRFAHCRFDTGALFGLVLDRFDASLPDAVLVRTIPAGGFEAVTRRLGLLHALRELGIQVWNDARAIEACVDKSMTSFLLARALIPTPPTWTVETLDQARAIAAREAPAGPLVLKPLFGSQGRGLRLIRGPSELPAPEVAGGVYYLQRFIGAEGGDFQDYRVLVSGGRALAAMRRRNAGWITNVKQGGTPEAIALDGELARLAERAAGAVGAPLCGVDVIRPPGTPAMVLEVNSMPAWSGLQSVTPFSIAMTIAEDVMRALTERWRAPA